MCKNRPMGHFSTNTRTAPRLKLFTEYDPLPFTRTSARQLSAVLPVFFLLFFGSSTILLSIFNFYARVLDLQIVSQFFLSRQVLSVSVPHFMLFTFNVGLQKSFKHTLFLGPPLIFMSKLPNLVYLLSTHDNTKQLPKRCSSHAMCLAVARSLRLPHCQSSIIRKERPLARQHWRG